MIGNRLYSIFSKFCSWSKSELLALALVAMLGASTAALILLHAYQTAAIAAVILLGAILFFSVFVARRVRIASALALAALDHREGAIFSSGASDRQKQVASAASLGCQVDYLKIARSRDKDTSLDATIVRTGSTHGRDLIAYEASQGAFNFDQMRSLCEGYADAARRGRLVRVARNLDPRWLMRLARLLAVQSIDYDDRKNALSLYRMVYDTQDTEIFNHPRYKELGATVFQQQHGKLYFDLALHDGQLELARRLAAALPLRPVDRPFVEADLANPIITKRDSIASWIQLFNGAFVENALEPVDITDERDLVLMDRLTCVASPVLGAKAKVTVIVTSWCPTVSLLSAVKSILAQSWSNLEIFVVDDASPSEYAGLFHDCQALDPRVKVLTQKTNGGTYVARNRALELATGDFVTFQDDDDWSHPRRIEKQVAPMLSDERIVSTTSQGLRCSQDLLFSHVGYAPCRKNASSLMFRRETVMRRIGYMDSVRKAADSEYALRILTCFGKQACLDLAVPLAVIRMRTDSLSRSEFKPGWHHPARESYRDAYQYWHKSILAGSVSPYRSNALEPRPFPAPTRFLVERDGTRAVARSRYDYVFAGDWRRYGGPQKSMLEEIQALTTAGYKVGILHLEAFRFMIRRMRYLCEPVHELLARNVIDEVILSDAATVDVLVLRYPPILQFLPAETSSLKVGSMLIVANQAPHERDGSDLRYEVGTCSRHAKQLFGVTPLWVPQGESVRSQIEPLLPSNMIDKENMPGIIDLKEWAVDRSTPKGEKPIVGRYSRDHKLKFPPNRTELVQAYPRTDDIDVRIMGGDSACKRLLKKRANFPQNWTVYEHGQIPVREFLSSIDFFVYFDHANMVEAFGRSLLEALASGCVVITREKFRSTFGEGAIYCEPSDVMETVLALYSDWERYSEQSRCAIHTVDRLFSHQSYVRRMEVVRLAAVH